MSDDVRTSVRLPEKLHSKVSKIADEERRSFNNLVIVMAEEYIENHYSGRNDLFRVTRTPDDGGDE